ncbi:hypothetical protein O988_09106, partial [Pseudogymnoascus sp. VKM F-3808]
YPCSAAVDRGSSQSSPPLVTSGPGVPRANRCGTPHRRAYEEDRTSLFINHLHDGRQDRGEGITPFYVRRSVYFAFFGKPETAPLNDHSTRGYSSESSSADSFLSKSAIQSPSTVSDEMDLIMTYYAQPCQSGAMDVDSDRSGRDDNEGATSRSGETHALIVRRQSEKRHGQLDQEQEEQQDNEQQDDEQQDDEQQDDEQQGQEQQEEQQEENQQEEEQQQNEHNRAEQGKLKKGRLEKEREERNKNRINITIRNKHSWANFGTLYPRDSKEVEIYIQNCMRNGLRAFNTRLQLLAPAECYTRVLDDNTRTIMLVNSHGKLAITEEMLKSAAEIGAKAIERNTVRLH